MQFSNGGEMLDVTAEVRLWVMEKRDRICSHGMLLDGVFGSVSAL